MITKTINKKIRITRQLLFSKFFLKRELTKNFNKYNSSHQYGLNSAERMQRIIVSLTTIPERLCYVKYVLDSMLRQSIKPDKLILFLNDKNEESALPEEFKNFFERGLEIRYVRDIGPHTKYFYAFKEFPESIIITVDDDIWYPENLVEKLLENYQLFPNAISANRIHKIVYNEKKIPLSYNQWDFDSSGRRSRVSFDNFATGVGGVLYPPKLLKDCFFDIDKIEMLSLKNDDIWLKVVENFSKVPVAKAYNKDNLILNIDGTQEISLNSFNVHEHRNDQIINDILKKYGVESFFVDRKKDD